MTFLEKAKVEYPNWSELEIISNVCPDDMDIRNTCKELPAVSVCKRCFNREMPEVVKT